MKIGVFHGMPNVTQLPGPKNYRINQTPEQWWGYRDSKGAWWIPRDGDNTDQGSMWLWIQAMIGISDDQFWTFYAHDDGCHFRSRQVFEIGPDGTPNLNKKICDVPVSRKEVDDMLRDGMEAEGRYFNNSTALQRYLVYLGVRTWAWINYAKGDSWWGRRKTPNLPPNINPLS